MKNIEPRNFAGTMFNVADPAKFQQAIKLLCESLSDNAAACIFAADNIITWNRNLSFLRDDFFIQILNDDKNTMIEKSVVWRTYVLLYFAEIASRIEGDFTEFGCHTGNTAANVLKKIDFAALDKKYYLYDLFGWKEGDEHTHMPGHDQTDMYGKVVDRFKPYPFVKVIKGSVPQSFDQGFPEGKIAFAHIDMNHPVPEAAALERVLPRLAKGGIIIFDDYGWWIYSAQKQAIDPIVEAHGLKVLELPTGQALLINS